MSYCVVVGCKNRSVKKNYEQKIEEARNRNFSFHLFPQNIKRKNKWLEAINLKNYIPRKQAAVCSAHFREDDYEPKYSFRKLKKDAVPYLLEEQSENQEIKCVKKSIEHHTLGSSSDNAAAEIEPWVPHTASSASSDGATAEIESWPLRTADISNERNEDRTEMMISSTIVQNCSSTTNTIIDPSTSVPNIMVDRSTSVSPERILNSPTKIRLREFHTHEKIIIKRKLAVSDYTKKKLQRQLNSLKGLLKELRKKNLITVEDTDILQHMDAELV